MIKATLTGHSGCSILLLEDINGNLFVRKSATNKEYNKRLEAQAIKQQNFRHPKLKAPRIYATGTNEDGLFYFDMEYVKGVALSEYIKTIEAYRIKDFIGDLVDNILSGEQEPSLDTNEAFCIKIASLEKSLVGIHKLVDEALALLRCYNWEGIGKTPCHGDLTLENIMVKGDDIYLIDFLDSFYDSVYIDLGKLLQDVIAMWSYRHDRNLSANTLIRLKVFKDLLIDKIGQDETMLNHSYHALLLHLLRILPYTKDSATTNFVIDKIGVTLNLIK